MNINFPKIIRIVLQTLLILVPLIWTSTTSELFEFPKMILTYLGATLLVSLWLMRMVAEKRLIFKRTFLDLPLLLFLASQLLSTLFSIDIHTSIFGYYSRFNGGLLSMLCYAAIYFVTVSNLTKKDVAPLLQTLLFTAFLASVYAAPEHFGHSPSCAIISGEFHAKCWVQDVQFRVFGTFGQPNWLAAYLISIIFLPLAKILEIRNKKYEIRSYLLPLISYLLFFLVLLFTKSRSGLIGFGISLTIFTIFNYRNNVKKILISYFFILISFLILGHGISDTTDKYLNLFRHSRPDRESMQIIENSPGVVNVPNSLEINITPSSDIRRIVWKGAIKLALLHPLFGTGVETFAYSYFNVRPVEHNLVSEWDFLYNKAHNEFLNYAATTGFIGLGTYLIFLGTYIIWSIKQIISPDGGPPQRNSSGVISAPILIALLSGFIALCVSNFFGFATVPVNTLLFLFPALAWLATQKESSSTTQTSLGTLSTYGTFSLYLLITLTIVVLYRIFIGVMADIAYNTGVSAKNSNNYQKSISNLQEAIKLIPSEALYNDELSLVASEVAMSLHQDNKVAEASEAAKIAVALSNKAITLNQVHVNFLKTRTKVFINLSAIDPRFAIEAGATLDKAISLSPTDAKLWFNRALLTQQLNYQEEAVNIYQKAIELKPNYEMARYQFGQLLVSLNRPSEAISQYQYILEHINPGNTTVAAALAELNYDRSKTK